MDNLKLQENRSTLLAFRDHPVITASSEPPRSSTAGGSEVERVFGLLYEWVVSAELRPGEFLSEPELAARCNTSRTPVREALGRLVQDGWITSIHRKGFRVRPISFKDISEVYTCRALFEQYAAERAAKSGTVEQFAAVEEIVDMESEPDIPTNELVTTNDLFHMTLAEMTGNDRIITQMRLIMAHVRRLETISPVLSPEQVTHRAILDAITARDGRLAHSLMGEHISFGLECMIRSFC
jgi:DNA-binding GntR family transcriptional regulator